MQNCVFSVHLEPEVSISVTNQRKYIFLLSCNGRFVVLECYFSISMNTKVENVCGHQIVMNVFRNRLHLDRSGDCLKPNSKKIKKIKKTPGFHSFLFQTCLSRMTAELIHVTLFWTTHPTCFANSVFFNEGQCEHNKHYAHIGLFHDVPGWLRLYFNNTVFQVFSVYLCIWEKKLFDVAVLLFAHLHISLALLKSS